MLSQAAERPEPDRVPTGPPLLQVPAAGAGSRGPAPALTSRASAPGRGGPGRAEWPRVPRRSPRRCLRRRRRRGWRLRREVAGRPGRRRLAPTEYRASLAAALAASAGGPRQKASPSRSARPAARPGTRSANSKVPLRAGGGRSNPRARWTMLPPRVSQALRTDDCFVSECGTEIPGPNPPGNGSRAGSDGEGRTPPATREARWPPSASTEPCRRFLPLLEVTLTAC